MLQEAIASVPTVAAAASAAEPEVSRFLLGGAIGFGAVIGWYIYFINRYRKDDVALSDLVTIIGAIGGAAVLNLFPSGTKLFGAYGIGLALGFFLYFLVLIFLVGISKNFDVDYFLDGRRRWPVEGYEIPGTFRQPSIGMGRSQGGPGGSNNP